jgi:hypothetical protein
MERAMANRRASLPLSVFALIALITLLSIPARVQADAFSSITLGVGVHAAISDSPSTDQQTKASPGVQLRLRVLQYLSLQVDYDFICRDFVPSEQATSPAELVAPPNLRLAAAIHVLPNRYLSPYFALGAGVNTEAGFGEASVLIGLGLETTLFRRWVIGVSGQVYYAPPGRVEGFIRRTAPEADFGVADYLPPAAYQLQIELTFYL